MSVTHVADNKILAIDQSRLEQTFRRRFDAWQLKYPRKYGTIDRNEGNNIFYLTMEQLDGQISQRISHLKSES